MPEIIEITDIHAEGPNVYFDLTGAQLESRQRPENGLLIAESVNVILAAIEAGYEPVSLLMERKKIANLPQKLADSCADLPIYTADDEVLEQLTGFRVTRGILCALKRKPLKEACEVLKNAKRLAVLWDIVDPTNVGAIFRSAAALGADGVIVSRSGCSPLHRRAARVSMGAVFRVPWAALDAESPEAAVRLLREAGFYTAALALERDAITVDSPLLREKERVALVLGTEGDGLPKGMIRACDAAVYIPMQNGVDSLNVGSAAAVAFWQVFGKRA